MISRRFMTAEIVQDARIAVPGSQGTGIFRSVDIAQGVMLLPDDCCRSFVPSLSPEHGSERQRGIATVTMVRTGKRGEGEFRRASWEEALDLVAKNLQELGEKYTRAGTVFVSTEGR